MSLKRAWKARSAGKVWRYALFILLALLVAAGAATAPLWYIQLQDAALLQSYHMVASRGGEVHFDDPLYYASVVKAAVLGSETVDDEAERRRLDELLREQLWELAAFGILNMGYAALAEESFALMGTESLIHYTAYDTKGGYELVSFSYEQSGYPLMAIKGRLDMGTGKLLNVVLVAEGGPMDSDGMYAPEQMVLYTHEWLKLGGLDWRDSYSGQDDTENVCTEYSDTAGVTATVSNSYDEYANRSTFRLQISGYGGAEEEG